MTVIRAVVDDFYDTARLDPMLGPIFEAHINDWQSHLKKMYGFWSTVILGDRQYTGDPFAKHQGVPELRGEHFVRWLDLFSKTVAGHCSMEDAAAWEATARRMGFAMSARLGCGEQPDLLP
jgi:hemoglobin